MKQITITRSKWRCGGDGKHKLGEGETLLKNEQGFMCCLGQWVEQVRPDINILYRGAPQSTEGLIEGLTKTDEYEDIYLTDLASNMITVNDDEGLPQEEREEELTFLAKEEGYELVFVD